MDMSDTIEDQLRALLKDVLGLPLGQVQEFGRDSALFGSIPELDSMAVAGLLTEMEDRLDIVIDDSDVDGALFETFGSLVDFVAAKKAVAPE